MVMLLFFFAWGEMTRKYIGDDEEKIINRSNARAFN
jgi:hypothetical protein